jgi:hypothetical protein
MPANTVEQFGRRGNGGCGGLHMSIVRDRVADGKHGISVESPLD